MRLSGSSTARPALTFWRRLESVGWPLALMCFGPKHRSGCALHVPTSGAKKRRNRDPSRKPHHTLGTSQEFLLSFGSRLPSEDPPPPGPGPREAEITLLAASPCPAVEVGIVLCDGVQQLQVVLRDTLLHDPPTHRTPYTTRGSVEPPERLPLACPSSQSMCLVGAHSLLTRQPNSSGPSWSPGMFTTRKRMSGWKVLRLRWTSYTVTPSHRYSPGGISLVTSCERTMVSSLSPSLSPRIMNPTPEFSS